MSWLLEENTMSKYRFCPDCDDVWEIGTKHYSFKYEFGIVQNKYCPECGRMSLSLTQAEYSTVRVAITANDHAGSTDLHHVLEELKATFQKEFIRDR